MNIVKQISRDLNINEKKIKSVKALLDDGGTIPFIARYRKEATGELDEVALLSIKESFEKYKELEKRKIAIVKSLKAGGFYSSELAAKIEFISNLTELEDLYLPYKPKRKTRGVKAKELGLEPLALDILKGERVNISSFINKDVTNKQEVINGCKDIIAEVINEDSVVRQTLRGIFHKKSLISSKVVKSKSDDASKYRDYFKYNETLTRIPSHRLLAILRGVSEGYLRFSITIDFTDVMFAIGKLYINRTHREIIEEAITDSYKRLLQPSLETELKNYYKEIADIKAITVFSDNLRELLLSPPLGEKNVLAIDPGQRTGSKVVILNKQGDLLDNCVIKPLPPHNLVDDSKRVINSLCSKYNIEVITIGNGTGGREVEEFCKGIDLSIPIIMTNESGASIYSASQCAREEFPNYDLTVRGAVSIGRRLLDPLSELVKLEPKSIGVGQYQHDVNQKLLKESLNNTVISCVNAVGVELNTASKELLSYVAGLNIKNASSIINYRESVGGFSSRSELLEVKGIGKKAYEQSAGFLRVRSSKNPLETSGVHPERYNIIENIASDLDCSVIDLLNEPNKLRELDIKNYITPEVGLPTLKYILQELRKPGLDPRDNFKIFSFDNNIKEFSDLVPGLTLPGIVTNVAAFGAFVDIGVHQDGLVHISQLSNSFVSDPTKIVKVGQKVVVKVMDIDTKRKRISLTMKDPTEKR